MKRILLSTVVLFVFSLAIMIFQVSCKKDAIAQGPPYTLPIATTERLGGVIVDGVTLKIDEKGVLSTTGDVIILNPIHDNFIVYGVEPDFDEEPEEMWTMNEDGSGKTRVNLALKPGEELKIFEGFKITSEGKIMFLAFDDDRDIETMYQCDKDGSNLKVILQSSTSRHHL